MDVEIGLIGGLMGAPEKIAEVYEIVRGEDFRDKRCGLTYEAIIEISRHGESPDLLAVAKHLNGTVDIGWLSTAYDNGVFPTRLVKDAKNIANLAIVRKIKKRALEIGNSLYDDPEILASQVLGLASESIGRDSKGWKMADVVSRFKETVQKNKGADYGISTGYMFLDDKFIRYMPGHVWVIGAKTSAGKTACLVDMICRLFEMGNYRAAIVSTEMMEEQNTARMLARMTGYHSNLILSGRLNDGWEDVNQTLSWLAEKDMFLFDDLYSFQDIEMRLRQISISGKLDVVFIDYIQNMSWSGSGTEYEKTNNIAKGLQRLAKQLKTCIVCLSQLSNSTARGDHDNLEYKGGGELAAVADLGVILKRNPKVKEELGFVIEKNRHGRTGKQVLKFVNNYTRLKEIVDHEENE